MRFGLEVWSRERRNRSQTDRHGQVKLGSLVSFRLVTDRCPVSSLPLTQFSPREERSCCVTNSRLSRLRVVDRGRLCLSATPRRICRPDDASRRVASYTFQARFPLALAGRSSDASPRQRMYFFFISYCKIKRSTGYVMWQQNYKINDANEKSRNFVKLLHNNFHERLVKD